MKFCSAERDTERQRLLNAGCQNSDENIPERRPVEATRQPGITIYNQSDNKVKSSFIH